MGEFKDIKTVHRIVVDCMQNVHPIYSIKDPVVKQGIQEVIGRITEYINAIYKATVQGADPKTIAMDWMKLVGDGILPAQNAISYDRNAGGSSGGIRSTQFRANPQTKAKEINFGQGWIQYNQSNPDHKVAAEENGIPW
jgi:rRNA processing protein Krr1/Pno1